MVKRRGGGGGDDNMKVVMNWSIGLAGIALLGLIMLILFGNLSGNVGFTQDSKTITVTNESADTVGVDIAYLNETGYTLSGYNSSWSAITITAIWNLSISDNYNITIGTDNASISSGVVTNTTSTYDGLENVSMSYTYAYATDSVGLANTNNFIGNYTESVMNTGKQFPTVGTIIGVALLLFILISLLIFALVKLGKIGGGSSGGNFG